MNLPRSFYTRPTLQVARELLGKELCLRNSEGELLVGRIVETEAYLQDDPGCHAYKGVTLRTQPLFREGGHAYVYLIYGMYYCLNISTNLEGIGEGVLIRAVAPLSGLVAMRPPGSKVQDHLLCSGPGRLCRSYGITKAHNGIDLTESNMLYVQEPKDKVVASIVVTPRIGIAQLAGRDLPYRFYIDNNASVSKVKRSQ